MSERIDRSALLGTWTQVHPPQLAVFIFGPDGGFELKVAAPHLAGQATHSRTIGGDWSLIGNRLQTTFSVSTPNSWAESTLEYVVVECGERLRLRGSDDDAEGIMEFERVG
jgi:hypothetical protein